MQFFLGGGGIICDVGCKREGGLRLRLSGNCVEWMHGLID